MCYLHNFHTTSMVVEDTGNYIYDHNPSCLCGLPVFYCVLILGGKKCFALYPVSFPVKFISLEAK